jgi:hypothetical protein
MQTGSRLDLSLGICQEFCLAAKTTNRGYESAGTANKTKTETEKSNCKRESGHRQIYIDSQLFTQSGFNWPSFSLLRFCVCEKCCAPIVCASVFCVLSATRITRMNMKTNRGNALNPLSFTAAEKNSQLNREDIN